MRPRDDRGSGAILVLVAVAIVTLVASAVIAVVSGIDARHRAQAAADLAAIAAASHAFDGDIAACGRAGITARTNGATLRACHLIDGIAEVEVRIASHAQWLGDGFIARARAGPSSASPT